MTVLIILVKIAFLFLNRLYTGTIQLKYKWTILSYLRDFLFFNRLYTIKKQVKNKISNRQGRF